MLTPRVEAVQAEGWGEVVTQLLHEQQAPFTRHTPECTIKDLVSRPLDDL